MRNLQRRTFMAVSLIVLLAASLIAPKAGYAVSEDDYLKAEANLDAYYPIDIDGHWAESALYTFLYADLVKGYYNSNGEVEVRPDQSISRAELVTILVRAKQISANGSGKSFTDVKAGSWYYTPVSTASAANIVGGVTEDKFAPNRLVTRAEIATIIARAFQSSVDFSGESKSFSDVNDHWAAAGIDAVSRAGIVGGYGDSSFKPDKSATRAEAMVMLQRALSMETSNLPADQTLIDVVNDELNGFMNIINSGDPSQLDALNAQYSTGLYKALSEYTDLDYKAYAEAGYTVEIKLQGTPSTIVVGKSNLFAELNHENAVIEVTIKNGGTVVDQFEADTSGSYLLKRMENGAWKIFY
jgi:hypothetical protein